MTVSPVALRRQSARAPHATAQYWRKCQVEELFELPLLELDLLRYFAENPGRVLSRVELQEEVWKLQNYPNRRMVDNFIMRLRRHFEPDPKKPRYFVSVRGAGYKFVPPES